MKNEWFLKGGHRGMWGSRKNAGWGLKAEGEADLQQCGGERVWEGPSEWTFAQK